MARIIAFGRRAAAIATCGCAILGVGATAAQAQPEPFKGELNSGEPGGLSCDPVVGSGNVTVARFCKGDPAPLSFLPNRDEDRRPMSWDGQPISADVTLPAEGEGPWPSIVLLHGYAGNKHEWETGNADSTGLNNIGFARQGYAVLTISTRGFGASCGNIIGAGIEAFEENGSPDSLGGTRYCPVNPNCTGPGAPSPCTPLSLVHLADARYEARDIQTLAGYLADDGIAEPAIATLGESYGGGQGLILARLKDRTMLPDGTTVAWRSPQDTAMRIAAVGAEVPWSDLANALMPNGRSLDTSNYTSSLTSEPVGVKKDDWVTTLYTGGVLAGMYPAKGCPGLPAEIACPDLSGWLERVDEGEPYDDGTGEAQAIAEEVRRYHSAMGVAEAPGIEGPPAPTVIASGWTDDLFPAIEGLRFHKRAIEQGGKSFLGLGSFGHPRGQSGGEAQANLEAIGKTWLDHYLKGAGAEPANGVRAFTQTCPDDAPRGGPFDAPDWSSLAQGEVTLSSSSPQLVDANGGRQELADLTDPHPIAGMIGIGEGGDACAQGTPWQQEGVATYKFPAATGSGYTMLGMPTIRAALTTHGADQVDGELAGRLWDLDLRRNTQTLISKGVYRLDRSESGKIVFQLQGNGWKFEAGHVPKVELLGRDDADASSPALGSFRASNNAGFTVDIGSVEITLPTREPLGVVPPSSPQPQPPDGGGQDAGGAPPESGATGAQPGTGKKGKAKKRKKARSCRKRRAGGKRSGAGRQSSASRESRAGEMSSASRRSPSAKRRCPRKARKRARAAA